MPNPKETMTSRQRVLAALNHQEPDRVPIDLGGNQTGIHKGAYRALIDHLGLSEEIDIMDEVGARTHISSMVRPPNVKELEGGIEEIKKEKAELEKQRLEEARQARLAEQQAAATVHADPALELARIAKAHDAAVLELRVTLRVAHRDIHAVVLDVGVARVSEWQSLVQLSRVHGKCPPCICGDWRRVEVYSKAS